MMAEMNVDLFVFFSAIAHLQKCVIHLPFVICHLTDLHWVTVLLSLLGKVGSSSAFSTVFLYSAEFFPTTIRNSALGVANFSARVGGMIAPYIVDLVVTISQIRTCEFKITLFMLIKER